MRSATADGAFSMPGAAVAVSRSQACEGGHLLTGEGAEFGQSGEDAGGGEITHALNLGQAGHFLMKSWVSGNEFFEVSLDKRFLFLQMGQGVLECRGDEGIGSGVKLVLGGGDLFDEMIAPVEGSGQLQLSRAQGVGELGLEAIAEVSQDGGINFVGFGQKPL